MFSSNAGRADISELIHGQASWLQDIGDWKSSADLFISLGQYMQAAKVIVESSESGWQNKLIDLVRVIPKDVTDVLIYCADELCLANEDILAREVLLKLGDLSRLMTLYVKKSMWTDAAKLAEDFDGGFDRSIFLPYAEWLITQDKFTDAMQAYRKADRKDLARKVITEMTYNSVTQFHFKDASYYFWLLSKENEISSNNLIEFEQKADLYFAYSSIYSYISDPFTHLPKEMLFQVSRFIINSLGISDNIPLGISKAYTYYTLARMAMRLELYKLARHCYDRLRKLQLTDKLLDEIEQEILIVQAKPVRDNPDYLPVCFRCGSTNPLLNPFTNKFAKGDICTNCGHPFVRSFINFEILPLVEFVPEPNIPDLDAIDMIRQLPNMQNRNSKSSTPKYSRDSDILVIADETETYSDNSDHFNRCLNITLEKQVFFNLVFYTSWLDT
jgi:intraflagellar transport protein 122